MAVLYYLRQVDNLNSPEDNRKLQKTVMAIQKLLMRNIVHVAVYLMSDIIASYETIIKEIRLFFEGIKSSNSEVLQASTKSADEIRKSYEKSKKEL